MSHVTVTIPAFNHERYIARAIESVLNQSHRDLDVVVVDDGSSDGTLAVARRYASAGRVRCERNPENLGLAANWNRCLELAAGPLVMVMGDDDELDAGYLGAASAIFDAHPGVGLVHAPVRIINADGRVVTPGVERPARLYAAGDAAVVSLLTGGFSTVTTVLRRECYERLGGYDETIRNGPDIEFGARIAAHYDVYDAGGVWGSFRWHAGKWGHLSFLQEDSLDLWMHGNRLSWSHVSPAGRRFVGIEDFEAMIARSGAHFAFNGALASIAHGRSDRALDYLRRAASLDAGWWRRRRFWQALALLALLGLGRRVMRNRMIRSASLARRD